MTQVINNAEKAQHFAFGDGTIKKFLIKQCTTDILKDFAAASSIISK